MTKNFSLLRTLAFREIKEQYSGSALGIVWQFITPVVLISLFWVIFSVGFRVQPTNDIPFAVWLTAGLAPWFFFAETITGSTSCITSNPHLVKRVVFPLQILPLVKLLCSLSNHLIFLFILFLLLLFNNVSINWFYLQSVYYFLCLVMLTVSISWISAAFNTLSRDTARLVNVLLQVGMWSTPIMWSLEILPEPYRSLFALNPMYYIVQGYRDSFLFGIPLTERANEAVVFWVVTAGFFIIGRYVFNKLRPQFADLV